MNKAREARAKAEAEFVDRARAWADGNAKGEADITRIAYKTIDKVKFEARSRNNAIAVNRVAVEAVAKIRFSAKTQGAKRERRWRMRQGKRLRLR